MDTTKDHVAELFGHSEVHQRGRIPRQAQNRTIVDKANPRINQSAEGFYYHTSDGKKTLDAFSGLWCCNLGHRHPKVSEAIKAQVDELDYSNAFNFGHPKVFELANVVASSVCIRECGHASSIVVTYV